MSKELYANDKERAGFTISSTKKGLKIDKWTADWNTKDFIIYVEETERFNKNTDFSAEQNDIYTYGEYFEEMVFEALTDTEMSKLNIYRVVRK